MIGLSWIRPFVFWCTFICTFCSLTEPLIISMWLCRYGFLHQLTLSQWHADIKVPINSDNQHHRNGVYECQKVQIQTYFL